MRSRSELARLAFVLGGLPILGCLDGSPAADAGLRYGDVLLSIDGVATSTWHDFLEARRIAATGFVARIFRDGVELDVEIKLRSGPHLTPLEVLAELSDRGLFGAAGESIPPSA